MVQQNKTELEFKKARLLCQLHNCIVVTSCAGQSFWSSVYSSLTREIELCDPYTSNPKILLFG